MVKPAGRCPRALAGILLVTAVLIAVAAALAACDRGADPQDSTEIGQTVSPSPSPVTQLYPVRMGVRCGYIDAAGGTAIRARFEEAAPFSEGLAGVRMHGRWGFIDTTGKVMIRPRYEYVEEFSDGLALVMTRGGRSLFIDKAGSTVLRVDSYEVYGFSDGLALFSGDDGYGFVNETGSEVIAPQFSGAGSFSEGLAAVATDGPWGFVDTTGKMVIQPQFAGPYPSWFSEGLAAVKSQGRWGYIDRHGTFVIEPGFRDAGPFSEGLAPVRVDRHWGYIDRTGKVMVEPAYQAAEPFSEGHGLVQSGGRYGFVDAAGREVVPPEYTAASSFESGLAAVTLYGEPGYIDADGATVWPRPSSSATLPAAVADARLAISRTGDIWTVRGDGRDLFQVTRGRLEDSQPLWSPDGKMLAFVRRSEGDTSAICLVSSSGGKVRTLVRRTASGGKSYAYIGGISWSPEGSKIAWGQTGSGAGDSQISRLMTVDVATGSTTELLAKENGFGAIDAGWSPCWSPDGERVLIAQSGMDAEGGQTWVLTLATGALRKLPVADASYSTWSPDGSRILTSTGTQETSSIRLLQADGRLLRTLARGGGWEGAPSVDSARFSPDGRWILYAKGGTGLWVMRTDGSDKQGFMDAGSADWR